MELANSAELARMLCVCQETVYRMTRDGRIPSKYVAKVGNNWRYNAPAIVEHLLSQDTQKKTPPSGDVS